MLIDFLRRSEHVQRSKKSFVAHQTIYSTLQDRTEIGKKLSSGLERLFFEQFTAEHHVFVFYSFCNGGSEDFELAIYCF